MAIIPVLQDSKVSQGSLMVKTGDDTESTDSVVGTNTFSDSTQGMSHWRPIEAKKKKPQADFPCLFPAPNPGFSPWRQSKFPVSSDSRMVRPPFLIWSKMVSKIVMSQGEAVIMVFPLVSSTKEEKWLDITFLTM